MTDCPNAEIRDLLPEYLHGLLAESDAMSVEQHVRTCDACADELALLRVALSVRATAPSLNVAAIVSRLPLPGQAPAAPQLRLSTQNTEETAGVRLLTSVPSAVRKPARHSAFGSFRTWQIAAVLTVCAAGGLSYMISQRGMVGITTQPQLSDTVSQVAVAPESVVTAALTNVNAPRMAISMGELSDYSDAELESLIRSLEQWDGKAAVDPLPGVPLLPSSSGSPR